MKELEMQNKTKSAPLPLDPANILMLQNLSDLFLLFKKKKLTNIFFYILKKWLKI